MCIRDRPGDDVLIVKGVDEGIPLLIPELQRPIVGIVVHPVDELHLRAVFFGGLHLGDGCAIGQTDDGFDPVLGGGEGYALGMVARRAGDNAMGFLLVGQLGNLIVGSAHLEGAGHLQIFRLQVHLAAGINVGRVYQVGHADDVFEHIRRMIHLIHCLLYTSGSGCAPGRWRRRPPRRRPPRRSR